MTSDIKKKKKKEKSGGISALNLRATNDLVGGSLLDLDWMDPPPFIHSRLLSPCVNCKL